MMSGHPWHRYWSGGPEALALTLLALVVFGFFVVGLAAVPWLLRRWAVRLRRRLSATVSAAVRARAIGLVLASDKERDEVVARLSHAVGEGRLSLEEGTQRIEAALDSRHRHQLAGLVADLPSPSPLVVDGRAGVRRDLRLFAICVLLAAAVAQGVAGTWVLWPLAAASWASLGMLPRRAAGSGRRS